MDVNPLAISSQSLPQLRSSNQPLSFLFKDTSIFKRLSKKPKCISIQHEVSITHTFFSLPVKPLMSGMGQWYF